MNNNRSFIIASQYFLLCKQSHITFMYGCQIKGEIFDPLGILYINMMCCQSMVIFHNIFLNSLMVLLNEMHSFRSNTDSTSHLELLNTENVSFSKGYAKLFLLF